MRLELASSLAQINPEQWDALTGDHPLLKHTFLLAMEQSGCASTETGWQPSHLLMYQGNQLQGAVLLYVKYHSRGEYVFDSGWAQAFEHNGLAYYPKLLSAIPFTPVPGPRLLARTTEHKLQLAKAAAELCRSNGLSSLHILFPGAADAEILEKAGFLLRRNVQFHWFNRGYQNLDAFLAELTQTKRKKLKQDSRKVRDAGVEFQVLTGADLSSESLDFFYRCYRQTYLEHGQTPYLNRKFFQALALSMPEQMVLILAHQHGEPIASALNIRSATRLYGRYWGSLRFVSGLHFETCYLQGIDYSIRAGLSVFEGGAQGEHKLSRGMLPVTTWSAHWVGRSDYAQAIERFLDQEGQAVADYEQLLQEHSPFRRDAG
jgi:hypothetical protein